MSDQINPTGTPDTYLELNEAATYMAANPGTFTEYLWCKIGAFENGDEIFCVGSAAGGNNAAIRINTIAGTPNRLSAENRCDGNSVFTAVSATLAAWTLLGIRFKVEAGIGKAYQHAVSVNGGAFSTSTLNANDPLAIVNMTIGASIFNGASPFGYCNELFVAYPSLFAGSSSDEIAALLYGSGPAAGDGLAPNLVDKVNQLHVTDSELNKVAGSIDAEWTAVGSNLSAHIDDNPNLKLSLGSFRQAYNRTPRRTSAHRGGHRRKNIAA